MKTYYDLDSKERKNYTKEFKKTPVGKDMNEIKIVITFFLFAIIILDILASFLFSQVEYDALSGWFTNALWAFILVDSVYAFYFNINFTAWLKNKHDIKRW